MLQRPRKPTRKPNQRERVCSYVVSMGLKAEERSEDWIIDSGASRHMTFQREILLDYKEFKSTQLVGLGDGYTVEAL